MQSYLCERRNQISDAMEDNSILISYAGIPLHMNEDDYHDFMPNSQFFWLTGLSREKQVLVMAKMNQKVRTYLFIEERDEFNERWTGKMPTAQEVAEASGVDEDDVLYLEDMNSIVGRMMSSYEITNAYFDVFRNDPEDMDDYNTLMAKRFQETYPDVRVKDLRKLVFTFRKTKDEKEIQQVRRAIDITANGLKEVLSKLKPGLKEYQVQAIFEGSCKYQGAKHFAFPTISASGINGCNMHYITNNDEVQDGDLILLDLGAKYGNYCSDITRTYPANGKYSPRQREIYDLVLKANRAVAEAAKPGMTLRELNDLAKEILGQGLVDMGMIDSVAEVGTYYMHSVSHSIGIDAHDVTLGNAVLEPGWIISDEPGIYIDEEGIGIRIEDDLLITEDGCECLSEHIARDADEIEAIMAGR
ncbi:MAG: M24 family metallopeptidase [Lachnospiraceae bacterium]|nr:M24 family metallopeptidase [Lachnospiraceae bacterium]